MAETRPQMWEPLVLLKLVTHSFHTELYLNHSFQLQERQIYLQDKLIHDGGLLVLVLELEVLGSIDHALLFALCPLQYFSSCALDILSNLDPSFLL